MKTIVICFFVIPIILLLSGCKAGGPLFNRVSHTEMTEAAKTTAQNTQAIERVVQGQQVVPQPITVTGTNNTVTVNPPPINTNYTERTQANMAGSSTAKTQDSAVNDDSIKLPKSIAMLIAAIATAIFGAMTWYVVHTTATGKALATVVDTGFAKLLHGLESQMATETDSNKLLLLSNIKSQIEKQRGITASS